MDTKFTLEQQNAINSRNCNLLVAAAAGSGKTAVLVERIIKKITDDQKPVDIDRLLVVTFTEASASEMRQRISKAIYARLESDYDNEHLKKQAALLAKSSICTIHSFCMNIIRKNFHLIDLDSDFKIADQQETDLLKSEVLMDIFEEEYQIQDNTLFFELVERYGGSKTKDDNLQALVLEIYEFLSSTAWPKRWLQKHVNTYKLENCNFDDLIYVKLLKEELRKNLMGIIENIERAISICYMPDGPVKYVETLQDDKIIIDELLRSLKYETFEQTSIRFTEISHKKIYVYRQKDGISENLKDTVKDIRDKEVKAALSKLAEKIFFKPVKMMKEDLLKIYPILNKLSQLVMDFSERYRLLKLDKNKADFSDLEHYCLQILLEEASTEDNPIASKAALQLREVYDEIFIDEYQDSNLVQELILSTISKSESKNRFMVGDIKQSIYKFRRANPEIFMQKYKEYKDFAESEGEDYKIDLSKNFRSRECVIDAVNYLFYQIMSPEVGEVDYNEKAALHSGMKFEETELIISDSTELIIVENRKSEEDEILNELSNIELEAKVVAKRINEIVNVEKLHVWNEACQSYVKAEYKDIVIVTRALSGVASVFVEELKNNGIPAFANTTGGFFETLEVQLIVSFLKIIDNPLQDIEIIAVLNSPIYMVTPDELMEIRSLNTQTEFYNCVIEYMNKGLLDDITLKLKGFIQDLDRLRKVSVHTKISELLDIIYEETGYFNYLSTMPASDVRRANLIYLQEKAVQYERNSYEGLFHFILYIAKLKESGNDAGNAKVLSENENIVRIMTIHKSKGLEFPIVFVSTLGKQFNAMDTKKNFVIHHDLGIGTAFIDLDYRIKTNTIARVAISSKMNVENISEELRVLYVALTRAKEKLILTGCVSNLEEKKKKWSTFVSSRETRLSNYFVTKCTGYLDIICAAVARHKDGYTLIDGDNEAYSKFGNNELYEFKSKFEISYANFKDFALKEQEREQAVQNSCEQLKKINENSNYSGKQEEITKKFTWKYKYENEKRLPTTVSVSELKKLYQVERYGDYESVGESGFRQDCRKPKFLKEKEEKMSGSARGTLIHTIFENLNVDAHRSEENLIELIDQLVSKNLIDRNEVTEIPIAKILKFSNSEIAGRMRNSTSVNRETAFAVGLTPYEVYKTKELENSQEIILVRGIIDLYFEENDGIVLLDYKSDKVKSKRDLINKYRAQLDIYKMAIEKGTNKKVKECLIYSLHLEDTIRVDFIEKGFSEKL